jgi:hypothetical protein
MVGPALAGLEVDWRGASSSSVCFQRPANAMRYSVKSPDHETRVLGARRPKTGLPYSGGTAGNCTVNPSELHGPEVRNRWLSPAGFLALPRKMQLLTEFSWRQPCPDVERIRSREGLGRTDLLAAQGRESQPRYARDRLLNGSCLCRRSATEKRNGQ